MLDHSLEVKRGDDWIPIAFGNRSYCVGFFDARQDQAPRLAMQVVRRSPQGERKVIAFAPAKDGLHIGQIAGFPSAEQYEAAAAKALATAQHIRSRASLPPS
jgi:hypothetical protein